MNPSTEIFGKNVVASFDVDAQRGFGLKRLNELYVPGGETIVDPLNEQSKYAAIRVGSADAHNEKADHVATPEYPQLTPVNQENTDVRWNRHCTVGTEGFLLLEGLPNPVDYSFFVWKGISLELHPYSACYHDLKKRLSTGVIEYLRDKGISLVVVGGLAWEFCVKETVLDLRKAGFHVILNAEATRGLTPEGITTATQEMVNAGVHIIERTSDLSHIID